MNDDAAIRNLRTYLSTRPADTAAADPGAPESHGGQGLSFGSAAWWVLAAHAATLRHLDVIDERGFAAVARGQDAQRSWAATTRETPRNVLRELSGRVDSTLPGELSGAAVLGLAAEEWIATSTRLVWRDQLGAIIATGLTLAARMAAVADAHANTNMPAVSGGRAVQPTTFGHLLGGTISPLEGAIERLQAAFTAVNRSPLGAGQLAGSVLVPDRDRQASLLGFDAPMGHTLDALMSVEDFVTAVEAIAALLAPVRRLLTEVLAWIRVDPSSFVLTADWQVRVDPVNPLLVTPEPVERLIADVRQTEADCRSLAYRLRELPYGPVGAHAGVLIAGVHELGATVPRLATRATSLLDGGMVINRAFLGNRSGRGYTTGDDLAIFLMQEESLPPAAAGTIAGMVLGRLAEESLEVSGITQEMIDSAAMLTIGREVKVEIERLGRFLAPRRYLERRQVPGSPSPAMTREWLASVRARLAEHRDALDRAHRRMDGAFEELEVGIAASAAEPDL